jgi:hypothetical protein
MFESLSSFLLSHPASAVPAFRCDASPAARSTFRVSRLITVILHHPADLAAVSSIQLTVYYSTVNMHLLHFDIDQELKKRLADVSIDVDEWMAIADRWCGASS